MARYRESVCRLCRREGLKLFLKGARCHGEKCAIERRGYAPGQHGKRRARKQKEYGIQLREKQKVKRVYGVLERQFRKYFYEAARHKGITGESLLIDLELRLDSAVYSLGLGASRAHARQLVTHGHVRVNGRRVDIPSCRLREGDTISLSEAARKHFFVKEALTQGRPVPGWLELRRDAFEGVVKRLPARADIGLPVNEQYIVEHYSR